MSSFEPSSAAIGGGRRRKARRCSDKKKPLGCKQNPYRSRGDAVKGTKKRTRWYKTADGVKQLEKKHWAKTIRQANKGATDMSKLNDYMFLSVNANKMNKLAGGIRVRSFLYKKKDGKHLEGYFAKQGKLITYKGAGKCSLEKCIGELEDDQVVLTLEGERHKKMDGSYKDERKIVINSKPSAPGGGGYYGSDDDEMMFGGGRSGRRTRRRSRRRSRSKKRRRVRKSSRKRSLRGSKRHMSRRSRRRM